VVTEEPGKIAYYINCDHEPDAFFYRSLAENPDLNLTLYRDGTSNLDCVTNTSNPPYGPPVGGIADLVQNLSLYDLVILEDSHLNGQLYLDPIETFVSSGHNLIMSEHVFETDRQGNGINGSNKLTFFGDANFYHEGADKAGGCAEATVVATSNELNLNVGDSMKFTQPIYIEVPIENRIADYNTGTGKTSCTVPPEDSNLSAIAEWQYGQGIVSFFSDFETVFTGARSDENFVDVVAEHIKVMGLRRVKGFSRQYDLSSFSPPLSKGEHYLTASVYVSGYSDPVIVRTVFTVLDEQRTLTIPETNYFFVPVIALIALFVLLRK
jgi:hypothetical protein